MECTGRLKGIRNLRYSDLEAVKLRNMVDMALSFSAMMRPTPINPFTCVDGSISFNKLSIHH